MAKLPYHTLNLGALVEQDIGFKVPSALAMLFAPRVIWAKEHELTGACISIRQTGHDMLVEWRSMASCYRQPFYAEYFRADTPEGAFAEACAYANEQLKIGPPPVVLEDDAAQRQKRVKAGLASGEARRQQKVGQQNLTVKVAEYEGPLYVGIDPALRKWVRWEEEGLEIPHPTHDEKKWIFKGAPRHGLMLEHLKIPGVCVIAEPTLHPTPEDLEKGTCHWDLLRDFYPAGNEENQKVTAEYIWRQKDALDCVVAMAKLAKSDPLLWRRGNGDEIIKSFF